jgi:uncharacterized protein YvpB
MIKYIDKKVTANQLAKELLMDRMEQALEFWGEFWQVDYENMTDKEIKAVNEQLQKRYRGVAKYLGFELGEGN